MQSFFYYTVTGGLRYNRGHAIIYEWDWRRRREGANNESHRVLKGNLKTEVKDREEEEEERCGEEMQTE